MDALLPVQTVKDFEMALKKVGARCETRVYEGQSHGFFNVGRSGGRYHYETLLKTDRFLGSLGGLTGPPTLAPPQR